MELIYWKDANNKTELHAEILARKQNLRSNIHLCVYISPVGYLYKSFTLKS